MHTLGYDENYITNTIFLRGIIGYFLFVISVENIVKKVKHFVRTQDE